MISTSLETLKQQLDHIFNPMTRVVPEQDWSTIKAIWIPQFHHDFHQKLQAAEKIKILNAISDRFGTIQGVLTGTNENYSLYQTTFFNPTWNKDTVVKAILQAFKNVIETQVSILDNDKNLIKKTVIGRTDTNMYIMITTDKNNKIIDAYPIFEQAQ